MTSFYPGPSRVYDEIPTYVKEGHQQGIFSMNHRSPEFVAMCKKTIGLLKKKLNIPEDFTILFASSATECWEILAQSVVQKETIHIFNGAFGEKWFDYTQRLKPGARSISFERESALDPEALTFTTGEMICVTQNETSNGTQVAQEILTAIQRNNPHHLIAVDVTSSMAGIRLDFASADFWFASVQKCFGLPAGLAVIAVSPRGMKRIQSMNENQHYNSLTLMNERMNQWQTPCTPNVMGIYLLLRTLQNRSSIGPVHQNTIKRFKAWEHLFQNSGKLNLLIQNSQARSFTVIPVKADPGRIKSIKLNARRKGFLLGEGYGALHNETFRIANFPALKEKEIIGLMDFVSDYL